MSVYWILMLVTNILKYFIIYLLFRPIEKPILWNCVACTVLYMSLHILEKLSCDRVKLSSQVCFTFLIFPGRLQVRGCPLKYDVLGH